jgi:MFS transporter, ACS family, D-galactonate transporter
VTRPGDDDYGDVRELRSQYQNHLRWSIVGLLSLASVINYLDRATISVSLPLIARDFGLGPEEKGLLLSAFFWSYALMQVPIGWAVDRFPLKWLYAATFAVWSLAQGLAGAVHGFILLLGTRIVLGVGESIYLPGGTKIVTLFFPPAKRGLPSGIFDFGTRIGMSLGGILVPILLVHFGWRVTFAIIGSAALLWLIPWLATYPARDRSVTKPHPEEQATTTSARPREPKLRDVLLHRNLIGICLGFFCFDYYWYLLVTWLPDYLMTVRHLTVLRAALYSAAPFLVFGVSEPIGGWIADRLIHLGWNETTVRKGVVTVGFLTGLLLIPAEHAASPAAAVWLFVGGSMVGLSTGNLIVILQSCAPVEHVGLWTGVENLFGNIAGVLAPLVTGFLIADSGSYAPGFDLAVGALVAGMISYWFVVGELKKPEP